MIPLGRAPITRESLWDFYAQAFTAQEIVTQCPAWARRIDGGVLESPLGGRFFLPDGAIRLLIGIFFVANDR